MKKTKIFLILTLIITVCLLASISEAVSSGEDNKPIVVCTTTILGSFAKQVGGDKVSVHSIVPPGVCPAHYDVAPSDVYAVSKASLVIYSGFEPWLDDLIEASGVNVTRVKVGGPWHPYTAALEYVRKIRDALKDALPEYSSYFEENAQTACEEINATAQEIKGEAEELSVSQVKVICMQWQKAFVSWLGFNIIATYKSPEKLTTSEILNLTSIAEKEEVALVIDNLPSGTKFGAKLAADVGAQHVILTNFPGAVPDTEKYAEMIEYNARQLFEAVKRYRMTQGEIRQLTEELNNASIQVKILTATTIIFLVTTAVEALVIYKIRGR